MQNAGQSRAVPRPADGYEGDPRIKLGAEEWPVPRLAPRQNRIIEPRIMPLLRALYPRYQEVQKLAAAGQLPPADFQLMSEEQYDTALDCIAAALTRAHPTFKRDDLLDMESVTSVQLIAALTVVMQQTGVFVPAGTPGASGAPIVGEIASPSTGTG